MRGGSGTKCQTSRWWVGHFLSHLSNTWYLIPPPPEKWGRMDIRGDERVDLALRRVGVCNAYGKKFNIKTNPQHCSGHLLVFIILSDYLRSHLQLGQARVKSMHVQNITIKLVNFWPLN